MPLSRREKNGTHRRRASQIKQFAFERLEDRLVLSGSCMPSAGNPELGTIEGVTFLDVDGDGDRSTVEPPVVTEPGRITLQRVSSAANAIGIDYHEPSSSLLISTNFPFGTDQNFERIGIDGRHFPYSGASGLSEEVKIAAVRPGNMGGFRTGDLFAGNGIDGQIARVTDDGETVINPWVSLPGDNNGLLRGSLHVDQTGVFGGDLIAVTTQGEVWRIRSNGDATKLIDLNMHLEGLTTVAADAARYGPMAGKILVGAEGQSLLFAIDPEGNTSVFNVGVNIEDIDLITPDQNFFGANFGTGTILGAPASEFASKVGDILLTQEDHSGSGLFRLTWNGSALETQELTLSPESAIPAQWEHVTFAPAGVGDISPVEPGLPGEFVFIDLDNDGMRGDGEPAMVTRQDDPATACNEDGLYRFESLPIETAYTVRIFVPPGLVPTVPGPEGRTVSLAHPGHLASDVNFGLAVPAAISGTVYLDVDGSGTRERQTVDLVQYLDASFRYSVVTHAALAGFEQPTFDDSSFLEGAAGFGTPFDLCPLSNSADVRTPWPILSDILLRKKLQLPHGASGLTVRVAVDNDVQVFINGHDISRGLQLHEGCATRDSMVFQAPDDILRPGENLLAVRARDRGGQSYLDVAVSVEALEPGISGNQMFLDLDGDQALDEQEPTAITMPDDPLTPSHDEAGDFAFSGIPPGRYQLRQVLPLGFVETTCTDGMEQFVSLSSGQTIESLEIGDFKRATIRGLMFQDFNGDGQRGSFEAPIQGGTVFLDRNGDQVLNNPTTGNGNCDAAATEPCTHTDSQGRYEFSDVGPGTHHVLEVLPAGWSQTFPRQPHTFEVSGFANLFQRTDPFSQTSLSRDPERVPGFHREARQQVQITATGCVVDLGPVCTSPDGFGDLFRGLPVYSLIGQWSTSPIALDRDTAVGAPFFVGSSARLTAPAQTGRYYLFLAENDGGFDDNAGAYVVTASWDPLVQSVDPGYTVSARSGGRSLELDFGSFHNFILDGVVFADLNGDRLQESNEPGLAERLVLLDLDDDHFADFQAVTNSSGQYRFSNLGPGMYQVFMSPASPPIPNPGAYSFNAASGQDVHGFDFAVDFVPPVIEAVRVVAGRNRRSSAEIQLVFSKPLDPATAIDPANYRIQGRAASILARPFGRQTPRLGPISYDVATRTVHLQASRSWRQFTAFRITVNAVPGIRDGLGILLDGDRDGVAGGIFVADVGVGTR